MDLDSFVNYIISNKNKCEIIKLDKDIDLINLQIYLCKKLINLYLAKQELQIYNSLKI